MRTPGRRWIGAQHLCAFAAGTFLLLIASAASAVTWTFAANEGQSVTVSGTKTVRYGVDTRWIEKTVSGTVPCTNAFFGNDPAYGVVKHCQQQGGTPANQPPMATITTRHRARPSAPARPSRSPAARPTPKTAPSPRAVSRGGPTSSTTLTPIRSCRRPRAAAARRPSPCAARPRTTSGTASTCAPPTARALRTR